MSSYRSRVMVGGTVVAILPTWSDGGAIREAAAKAGRTDIAVQDGEWHGVIPGMQEADAPEPTHRSYLDLLSELRLA